jgi:hypothetical protein
MQAVTAIGAVTASHNGVPVRGDGEHGSEKSFEATLREAEGVESSDQGAVSITDTKSASPVEGVLQGRQALRQRARRSDAGDEPTTPLAYDTQNVQALLGGLLGDAALTAQLPNGEAANVVSTGALEAAVGLVGEIVKPATAHGTSLSAGSAENTTVLTTGEGSLNSLPATQLGTHLAETGMNPVTEEQLEAARLLVENTGQGLVPRGVDGALSDNLLETAAVTATAYVAEQPADAEQTGDAGTEYAAHTAASSDNSAQLSTAPAQSGTVVTGVQSSGGNGGATHLRSGADGSMVDAAKAAWQGLEMQRVGRNVAASVQTAHGEVSVVAQVAHGETHMLAELPNSLVYAMSQQVRGELRRELHDNGILTGEMEFRESGEETEQRRSSDQREEAEHGWS